MIDEKIWWEVVKSLQIYSKVVGKVIKSLRKFLKCFQCVLAVCDLEISKHFVNKKLHLKDSMKYICFIIYLLLKRSYEFLKIRCFHTSRPKSVGSFVFFIFYYIYIIHIQWSLAIDRSIVINKADKDLCIVVWNREDYIAEVSKVKFCKILLRQVITSLKNQKEKEKQQKNNLNTLV